MSIADALKDARKKKGISQRKLALKTGISLGAIQGYEQGRYKPKYEQAEKLSNILEIPISALIEPTVLRLSHSMIDLFSKDASLREIILSPEEKALDASLNHSFTELNISGKRKLVEYAEDLTKIPEYRKQPSRTAGKTENQGSRQRWLFSWKNRSGSPLCGAADRLRANCIPGVASEICLRTSH